jgi:uncharacterized protein (TIGR00162 family)
MSWTFESERKKELKLNKPILIAGLPGIANVGKITADFVIDELKAKKLYNIFSYDLPNSVFVSDKNLIELPVIELYFKQRENGNDILILTGDVQPAEERSSYEFCEAVLDTAQKLGVQQVITLGGIGLIDVPKTPNVFCTGNSEEAVDEFCKGLKINKNLYGIVGPIIGVSGLLVGMAAKKKIPAVCLLAETLGHPAYLGMRGARELVEVLNKKLALNINMSELDKEIQDIENEILERSEELMKRPKKASLKKIQGRMQKETQYIG